MKSEAHRLAFSFVPSLLRTETRRLFPCDAANAYAPRPSAENPPRLLRRQTLPLMKIKCTGNRSAARAASPQAAERKQDVHSGGANHTIGIYRKKTPLSSGGASRPAARHRKKTPGSAWRREPPHRERKMNERRDSFAATRKTRSGANALHFSFAEKSQQGVNAKCPHLNGAGTRENRLCCDCGAATET